ncbi:MAG: methyltransferase domain-containing protein [Planctomycetia bacterium]|nr:methyltransferase domain-containing protein [Planctomycetia bacterium]
MSYDNVKADELWSFEANKNAREIIITGTGDNEELYEESAFENINFLSKFNLIKKTNTTLHIGCGNGRIEKHLAKLVKKCVGVDISTKMVELANERCADLDNVEFIKGSGFELTNIGDKTIDVAYSFFVFQHIPRDCVEGYFKELSRVLKPNGKILCQFQLLGDMAIKTNRQEPQQDHPSDIRLYSIEAIEDLANRNGFSIINWGEKVQAELDSKRRIFDCNIFPIFELK